MRKPYLAVAAGVVVGFGALAAYHLIPGRAPLGSGGSSDVSAGPTTSDKPGGDPYGFTAAFDKEIKKVGQISPQQFAQRYPVPAYLPKLTWDPTTGKFFDKVNVEKVLKVDKNGTKRELPGYKLTDAELAKFKQNGFVVSERLGGYSFGDLYYGIYTRDLPVFVTSDSVLHAWHRSYDAMLEELELTYLMHSLNAMLGDMHAAIPAANAEYGNGLLKDSVRDADYFLAVARNLLHADEGEPKSMRDLEGRLPEVEKKDGIIPTKLDQDARVKETLAAVKNQQIQKFVLFGRERDVDFSQFKPRGHYETCQALRKYFRAMMWCGRTDLRIEGGRDWTGHLSADRELGASMVLLDLLRRADKFEAWRQFDRCIQTFVGRTDSATFDDLGKLATAAKITSPADLKTEADLQALAAVIADSDIGKQDIRGDAYVSPRGSGKIILPRSFTVLGQKFVVDSWVTAKTVYDDIKWDNFKVKRRVPSGLDVSFAALGNNHVVPDLVQRIEGGTHHFRDGKPYQHNLAAVRNILDSLPAKEWDDTIYMTWLKTLRTLSAPADAKMPEVMRTREWAMKQTNTQFASWAQLRHDTILYVKQSYTGITPSCYYPAGFVEPVVPFWAQMDAMASRSATLLEQTSFPEAVRDTQAKQVAFLRKFATRMGQLRAIAEKELNQQELTAIETKMLEDVMQLEHFRIGSGGGTRYNGWYPALFYRGNMDSIKWDALVADVHTDTPSPEDDDPGCVLHQGVGNVDLMIIAIDNGKDRVVYVGPTMSHYEFEMPGVSRKSDKEWKAELLDAKVPPRPEWTRGYLVPNADRKPADANTKAWRLRDE